MNTPLVSLLAAAPLALFALAGAPPESGAAAAVGAGPVLAQPAAAPLAAPLAVLPQAGRDESLAPEGTWQVEGGALSRARISESSPVFRGPLERRFAVEPAGELDSEPLFDQQTLLTVARRGDERVIELWDMSTGRRIGDELEFQTPDRVAPCFVDGELVVRAAADTVEVHRLGRRGLRRVDRMRFDDQVVGHPLLVGGDVVVAVGDSLRRYATRKDEPLWSVEGAFRGHLAFAKGKVYAVEYEAGSGMCRLTAVDLATGEVVERRAVGRLAGSLPALPGEDRAIVRGDLGFVQAQGKLGASAGITSHSVGLDLTREASSLNPAVLLGSTFMTHPPAVLGRGWFGFYDHPIEGDKLVATLSPPEGQGIRQPTRLAGKGWHDELLEHPQAPVFARNVAYFAGLAWDASTARVLWREPQLEETVVYPAHESLVAVRDGRTVELWTRQRAAGRDDVVMPLDPPDEAEDGLLVLLDGEVVEGKLELQRSERGADVALVGKSSSRRYRGEDAYFAALADGRVLYAADRDALVEGLDDLADRRQVAKFEEVLRPASRCGDLDLMRHVQRVARQLRVDPEETEDLDKAIAEAAGGSEPKVNKKNHERTIEGLEEAAAARREVYWNALEGLWEGPLEVGDDEDRPHRYPRHLYTLLELTLAADPSFEPARERLASLLPEDVELPDGPGVVEWVAFAEVNAIRPVELWFPPQRFDAALSWEQEKLDDLKDGWREDIVGYRTDRLFVVTPLQTPGSIARCLALSEQLCDILESMFPDGEHERDTLDPLIMLLFETRQEYLVQSAGEDPAAQAGLAWTAGHYNPRHRLSRLFLPEDDADWSSVTETLLHELTHHWIDCRNPRISEYDRYKEIGSQRGYWIVEGFASLTQNFVLDPYRGTYDTVNPRSDRLDLVANARDDQLLPWKVLFRREHFQLMGLQGHSFDQFPLSWTLGAMRQPGGIGLFYAQAATVCQYLYNADGGKYRQQLYDYLVSYYTGNSEGLVIEDAFGMSEEELGRRAAEWGRKVVRDSLGRG